MCALGNRTRGINDQNKGKIPTRAQSKKKKNHNVNNKEITAKNLKLTSELPLPHPHSQYPLLECPVARKMLVKTGHILSWLTPRAVGEISPLRTSSLPGQMGSHCRGIGVASEK